MTKKTIPDIIHDAQPDKTIARQCDTSYIPDKPLSPKDLKWQVRQLRNQASSLFHMADTLLKSLQ